jgi:hypothetical protein
MVIAGPAVFGGIALATQDKYGVQVPGRLALGECRGYDDWPAVAGSQPEGKLTVIVASLMMMDAYRAGILGNGKSSPDGSKIVKILWNSKQSAEAPFEVAIPGTLSGVGCMVKDRARFPDSGGWGYAPFDYDAASDMFVPNTSM